MKRMRFRVLTLGIVVLFLALLSFSAVAADDYTAMYASDSEINVSPSKDGVRASWSSIDGGGVKAYDLSFYYLSSNYRATFNSLNVTVPDDAYYRLEFTAEVNVNRDSTDSLRDHAKTVAGGYVVGTNPRTDDAFKNNTWPFHGTQPDAKADYVYVDSSDYNVTQATKNFTVDGIRNETVFLFTATYPDSYLVRSDNNYIIFKDVKFTKLYNDITVSSSANGKVIAMDCENTYHTVSAGTSSKLANLRGSDMILYAFPEEGYVFDHWEDEAGTNVSSNGALTVTTGSSGEDDTAYNYKAVFREATEDDVNLAEYLWADCEENLVKLSDVVILGNLNDQFNPYDYYGSEGIATDFFGENTSSQDRYPHDLPLYSLTFGLDIPEDGAYIVFDAWYRYHRGYVRYEILVDNVQELYHSSRHSTGSGRQRGTMTFGPYDAGLHTVTVKAVPLSNGETNEGMFLNDLRVISEDIYHPTLTLPEDDLAKITSISMTRKKNDYSSETTSLNIADVRSGTVEFNYNDRIGISYEDTDPGRYIFKDVIFDNTSTENSKGMGRSSTPYSVGFDLRGNTGFEFIYEEFTNAEFSQMILKDPTQKAPDGEEWDWSFSNAASITGLSDSYYSGRGVQLANEGDWISLDLTIPEEKGDQFIYFYARNGYFNVTVSDADGVELASCSLMRSTYSASYDPTSVFALAPGSYTIKIESTYSNAKLGNFCCVPYDEATIGTIDLTATATLLPGTDTEDATEVIKAAANLPEFLFFSNIEVSETIGGGVYHAPIYVPVYVSPTLADKVAVATNTYKLTLDSDKIFAYIPKELVGGKHLGSNRDEDIVSSYTDGGFKIIPLMISREEATKGIYVLSVSADKKEDISSSLTLSVSDSGGDGTITYGESPVPTLMLGNTDLTAQSTITYSADGENYKELSKLLGDSGVLDAVKYYVKAAYSTDTKYGVVAESFDVEKMELTVTMDASAVAKVYDTLTTVVGDKPVLTLSAAYGTEEPVIDIDSVVFEYDNKNAGENKKVKATDISLSDADVNKNYTLASTVAEDSTAKITTKLITITGLYADDKDYDGGTDVAVLGTAVLDGNLDGENLTLKEGTASFSDKNAAVDKTVTFSGYELSGTEKDNYYLTAQPASVKATIDPLKVDVTVSGTKSYTYNGKAEYTHTATYTTVGGDTADVTIYYDGATELPDTVKYDNGVEAYVITVTVDDGNYELSSTLGTTSFTIEQAPISIASATVSDKTYDTTTDATVTEVVFEGLYEELLRDSDYTVSATFRDANVANEVTADVTVTLIDNSNTRNYKWASDDADKVTDIAEISTWDISGTLTVTFSDDNNGDGIADIGDVLLITGVAPDTATVDWTWSFNGAEAVSGTDSLEVTADNLGDTIAVTATGTGNYSSSLSIAPYRIGARTLSGTISIDGTTALGETLTASLASASGEPALDSDYRVQWHRVAADGTTTAIDGATALTYTLVEADIGKTVRVEMISDYGTASVFTGTLSEDVEIPATAAAVPVIEVKSNNKAVIVSWTAPFNGGSDITGYTLTVTDKDGNAIEGSPISIGAEATSYRVSELTNNTEYSFVLTATNGVGSTDSEPVTAKPSAISIIIAAAGNNKDDDKYVTPSEGNVHNCPSEHLKDVDKNAWYHPSVDYVVENGIMQGVSGNSFDPSGSTTRAMIVTTLWRLEGEPVVNYAMTFEDVKADAYYAEAVRWAASEGLVVGYSANEFRPDTAITREQMAAIIYRYAEYKDVAPTGAWAIRLEYTDLDEIANYATEAVMYCTLKNLMQGRDGNAFAPRADASRAEIAVVLHRFIENN